MTAPTCQNCKHWDVTLGPDTWSHSADQSARPCVILSDLRPYSKINPPPPAWSPAGCGCCEAPFWMFTLPTFSCNQHTPREE
jgi:hypothetical protein